MLAFAAVLFALPTAMATFWPPVTYCGTTTATCTKTTTVPGGPVATSTCTKWGNCYNTVTATARDCKTTDVTVTTTSTRHPTVYVDASATKTITRTVCAATITVCPGGKQYGLAGRAKVEDPEIRDLTNAERIQRGLPLRSPAEEKKWFLPQPSCRPTTVTDTAWVTKTTGSTTVTTSTSCLWTTTTYLPNSSTYTRTHTACATITGAPTTITRPCVNTPTVTVRTTATYTRPWC